MVVKTHIVRNCMVVKTHIVRNCMVVKTHIVRNCMVVKTHIVRNCMVVKTHIVRNCMVVTTHDVQDGCKDITAAPQRLLSGKTESTLEHKILGILPVSHKEAVSICCHSNSRRLAEVCVIVSRLEGLTQSEEGLSEVVGGKLEDLM